MNKMSVRDVNLKGKRVLMRVDFNVPMAKGIVTDDKRIKAALPTIQYVLDQGASLILMSHLGRPKGTGFESEFSLKAASETLATLLEKSVQMDYLNALHAAREKMDSIEVDRTRVKPLVKITNNVIIRTDGTVAPCFPMYAST